MAKLFEIHPLNPQLRLIKQVADELHKGAVIAYPTDSGYALGTALGKQSQHLYVAHQPLALLGAVVGLSDESQITWPSPISPDRIFRIRHIQKMPNLYPLMRPAMIIRPL